MIGKTYQNSCKELKNRRLLQSEQKLLLPFISVKYLPEHEIKREERIKRLKEASLAIIRE
jgi:hypothetical protein